MGKIFKSKCERLLEKSNIPKEIEYWHYADSKNPSKGKKYIVNIKPTMKRFEFGGSDEERMYLSIKLNEILGVKYGNNFSWSKFLKKVEKLDTHLIFYDEFPLTKDNTVKNIFYNIHEKHGLEKKFIKELFEPSICGLLKQKKKKFDPKQIKNNCKKS
ncbi:MAG TPA: hypothetical protein VJ895_02795 [Candidatus Nanoarchaeia archaeon]|nr:hypothetical protein [Candidatus Nanoarchaeia archaeon]